jgi:hypothetical protein
METPLKMNPTRKEAIFSFFNNLIKAKYTKHVNIPINMFKLRRYSTDAFSVKSASKGEYLKTAMYVTLISVPNRLDVSPAKKIFLNILLLFRDWN